MSSFPRFSIRHSLLTPTSSLFAIRDSLFASSFSPFAIRYSLFALPLLATLAFAQEKQTPTALPSGDGPPRNAPSVAAPKLPVQELAGPRQLLDLFSIGRDDLEVFADGEALRPDEQKTLLRILYRIPRFAPHDLQRWRRDDLEWEELAADPQAYRAASVRLSGRVQRIEAESLSLETAKRLEFTQFYRVSLTTDDAPFPLQVYARAIPQAWQVGADVDYRAEVEGLFLKVLGGGEDPSQLLVVCDRVAWRPDTADPALGVGADQVLLASLGVDLGQFDRVLDRKEMTGADRECFYQMLDAAARADPTSLQRPTAVTADLGPMLQTPREIRGRLLAIQGQARRVQEIQIGERDIQERFGIDHYYEIDVFVPLEHQRIKMGEGEHAPVFENYFPVIFCVARLPEGMQPDDVVNREVRIPAFFFKVWEYETEFMKRQSARDTQLSPLLVGAAPEVTPPLLPPTALFGTLAAGVVVATLAAAWVWLWFSGRRENAATRELRRRRYELDKPPEIGDIEPKS